VFGENRKIREIVPVERNDAHRLIEECMLCANVAAARLLEGVRLPALYRIHEGPNQDKLDSLRDFLTEMGLYLGGGDSPTTGDYQQVLQQIAGRPDRHLLQTQLIRSMMQAVYSPDNCGHFGLSFPEYTHFTSPIRRYPDLLVHRAIRYLIRNKKDKSLHAHPEQKPLAKKAIYPYEHSDLDALGEVCSTAERRADAASYSVADWLKCEYMQDHVGDEFAGTITAVTSFGLFVELNEVYVEGLVHITELSNDYYHFDPVRHQLQGERSGSTYQLGGSVTIRIVRVDLEEKKIDLQMVGIAADSRWQSRKQKGGVRQDLKDGKHSAGKGGKGGNSRKSGSSAKDGDGESRGQKRGKSSAKGGDKVRPNAKSKPGVSSKAKPKQKRAGKSNNKAATTSQRKGKNSSSKGAGKKSGTGSARGQSAKRRPR
jgi:ribonuclease R